MTPWTSPDQDILRRISFQLQRPGWRVHSPATGPTQDGKWHACNGSTDLAADSLAALLDELDWFHAS